jgi:hypothetical protein
MTTADPKADKAFLEFHAANPSVYNLFVSFAREAKNTGAGSVGAKAVWERLRWEVATDIRYRGEFKLNNNYTRKWLENWSLRGA